MAGRTEEETREKQASVHRRGGDRLAQRHGDRLRGPLGRRGRGQQRPAHVAEPGLEPALLQLQRGHLERQVCGAEERGPWYVDAEGEIQQNTSYGTYEKTSEDPLTVKYTVADDTTWSDGTPVDAADVLLAWAAGSGNLNTIAADKVKTDDATGLPQNTKGKVYFDTSSQGLPYVTKTPEISDDGKTLTLEYDKPFEQSYMRPLFEYGRQRALRGDAWVKRPPI